MPPARHKDGLSRRQRALADLFPDRAKGLSPAIRPPAQLSLGVDPSGYLRVKRCPGCAAGLVGNACKGCDAFLCVHCDRWTSGNGGDGSRCYLCLSAAMSG
jgi:hypothetical protein